MSKFKETTKINGIRVQKAVQELPDTEPKVGKKYQARKEIEEQVFDIRDSVADNSKMISLLFTMVYKMYESLPDSTMNKMPKEDKTIIDNTIEIFKSVHTWADIKFQEEGFKSIERLIKRQGELGKVIKKVYSE